MSSFPKLLKSQFSDLNTEYYDPSLIVLVPWPKTKEFHYIGRISKIFDVPVPGLDPCLQNVKCLQHHVFPGGHPSKY